MKLLRKFIKNEKCLVAIIGIIVIVCTVIILVDLNEKSFFDMVNLPVYRGQNDRSDRQNISTFYYSYYSYENGIYRTQPGFYEELKCFTVDNTVLIVIDPWKDMPFSEVNEDVIVHCDNYITPIVDEFAKKGGLVYIFTNDSQEWDYDTQIVDSLAQYVDDKNVRLLYYSDNTREEVAEQLISEGRVNLVYMGYATEMCVLFRSIGIMTMNYSEYANAFDYYIVPEATMALISERDNDNTSMRNDICIMLAQQGKANIVVMKDLERWIKDI